MKTTCITYNPESSSKSPRRVQGQLAGLQTYQQDEDNDMRLLLLLLLPSFILVHYSFISIVHLNSSPVHL